MSVERHVPYTRRDFVVPADSVPSTSQSEPVRSVSLSNEPITRRTAVLFLVGAVGSTAGFGVAGKAEVDEIRIRREAKALKFDSPAVDEDAKRQTYIERNLESQNINKRKNRGISLLAVGLGGLLGGIFSGSSSE